MIWDEHRRMAGFRTESGETRFERDPAGRLLSAVDPTGVSTRFDWDERGLLRSATDAAGGTSSYAYDERGRLVAQTMPGGRTTSWAYDLGGRVGSTIDPMGVTTDVIRNGSGTVTGVRRARRRLGPHARCRRPRDSSAPRSMAACSAGTPTTPPAG